MTPSCLITSNKFKPAWSMSKLGFALAKTMILRISRLHTGFVMQVCVEILSHYSNSFAHYCLKFQSPMIFS